MRTLLTILSALSILLGCDSSPSAPGAAKTRLVAVPRTRELVLSPISSGLPRALRLDGELQAWPTDLSGPLRVQLPMQLLQLRIDFQETSSGNRYHSLRVDLLQTELRVELPVLPRILLDTSIYVERIDLLQEFIRPWSGSRLRRWQRRQLRVALPPEHALVNYRASCVAAMQRWNELLGWELFVAAEAEADIFCTLAEESQLAYAHAIRRDTMGRPIETQIHLSPRWSVGAEKYVQRTYVHELGHAMGLWGHSVEREHVMNGRAVIVDSPHEHEIGVAKWYWNLPADFEFARILRDFSKYEVESQPEDDAVFAATTRCATTRVDETEHSHPE